MDLTKQSGWRTLQQGRPEAGRHKSQKLRVVRRGVRVQRAVTTSSRHLWKPIPFKIVNHCKNGTYPLGFKRAQRVRWAPPKGLETSSRRIPFCACFSKACSVATSGPHLSPVRATSDDWKSSRHPEGYATGLVNIVGCGDEYV
jgi:hypothetical protein